MLGSGFHYHFHWPDAKTSPQKWQVTCPRHSQEERGGIGNISADFKDVSFKLVPFPQWSPMPWPCWNVSLAPGALRVGLPLVLWGDWGSALNLDLILSSPSYLLHLIPFSSPWRNSVQYSFGISKSSHRSLSRVQLPLVPDLPPRLTPIQPTTLSQTPPIVGLHATPITVSLKPLWVFFPHMNCPEAVLHPSDMFMIIPLNLYIGLTVAFSLKMFLFLLVWGHYHSTPIEFWN